jgi:transposase
MTITTIGLDLAKSVFQVHGVDARGAVVVRKMLRRGQVLNCFSQLGPCLVGIEACGPRIIGRGRLCGLATKSD